MDRYLSRVRSRSRNVSTDSDAVVPVIDLILG